MGLMGVATHARAQDADDARDRWVTARLAHVERVLSEDEQATRTWWRSWIGVQSALFAGNVGWGLLTFDQQGARAEHFLNAGGSLLGAVSLILLRPPVLRARAQLRSAPAATPSQREAKLASAEALLEDSADAQDFGSGVAPFAGATLVGTAIAMPLWLKYDRKVGAASSLLGALAITSLQVVTLPTASLEEQRQESTRDHRELSRRRERGRRGLTLSVMPSLAGLHVMGTW